ncbi:hypothetical protein BD413DRAFT_142381 [Trametes elegans]|nr:hypothetical protein BD413DRAFT_142381 [Trametes elegans]
MDRPCVSPRIYTTPITPQHHHINSHSPLPPPDAPSRDNLPPRSPSPPPQQHYHHPSQIPHPAAPQHEYPHESAYHDYPRSDSRLSDSRLFPPPSAIPARHPAPSADGEEVTPPGSPPHKRFKYENASENASPDAHPNAHPPPPPYPCNVDQRSGWHYSHAPYPQSFYPYPYHHQNMPHRVEDMSVDRSISHRSDGHTQYQFMPSHPTPPPIATLHHSPALSASSLESNSISPSPPITQPSTPYYSHPVQAHTMNQAPPYPYQPNGSLARYSDEAQQAAYGTPSHAVPLSTRSIRPTIVAAQPYPGQANYIIHTDDANTKLSDRVRRKCFNCRTTDTSTWRRSSLTPGKVLCNKCGLFERTHSRPRPEQFPPKRGPVVPAGQFKHHRGTPPPTHAHPSAQAQAQGQRLPSMSMNMLPPHHYSHPSLSPLMAARTADPQQYRASAVPEIGALLNGPQEGQAEGSAGPSSGAPSAGGSPQQAHQQVLQQQPEQQRSPPQQSLKRPASPLERDYQAPPPPQMSQEGQQQAQQQQQQHQQQQSAQSSPQSSSAGAPSSSKSSPRTGAERRDAPTYRASN